MKAIAKITPQPGLQLIDVPIPKIHPHEILIKIRKTSICGTDLHIYKWDEWAQKTVPTPLVIGHEFMGEVAEVGKEVKGIQKGARVSGEGHLTCGLCPLCKKGYRHLCMNTLGVGVKSQGCFAEYLALPAENAFLLPNSVSDDIASFFDPFGNAVHTALSFPLTTEDVLITGAGPIGIMAAAVARHAGARTIVITDHNEFRLQLAKKMGATHTVNIQHESVQEIMKTAGISFGFTVGLEMAGHPQALNTQLETAQHGAHLALLGILPKCPIDWNLVIFKMLVIKGIYGREIFKTWHQMAHLLDSGLDLNPLITHQFDAKDYEKGFAAMQSGNCGKVILNW